MLSQIFKNNRAEEFPDDLWGTFVLPLEYHKYNLLDNNKGSKIIGGRGSGKTMYLKYHCYPTQLSKKRGNLPENALQSIGIYWRPDTHFVQLINAKYLDDSWSKVFNTFVGLSLLTKFSKFLENLVQSNYKNTEEKHTLQNLKIPTMLQEELKSTKDILYVDLHKYCSGILFKLQNWLHDPTDKFHILLDGKSPLSYIIEELKSQHILSDTIFHIFIDEFENLRHEQQIIINTWMKHGENPLIFNVAYKKHANITSKTSGPEQTQRRNDHRILDILDDVYAKNEKEFKVFSAEIIANKLQEFYQNEDIIDSHDISDITKLSDRRDAKYQDNILLLANNIFPNKTYQEISIEMLKDSTLRQKIVKNIQQALKDKSSSLEPALFISDAAPEASIVNSILLFRKSIVPEKLLENFKFYLSNDNKPVLKPYKEQISNNLVGAILFIYSSFPKRICPIYAGFDRFHMMAKSNLRHLLELCYQSFIEFENNIENIEILKQRIPKVDIKYQLIAAKFCSKQELETISEHGEYGQRLQKIANRLGLLFILKQKIRTQSKPENIHFSVETLALNELDEEVKRLLHEAQLWNVLQEYDATKGTTDDIAIKEYMLTPILAPYYQISYRKKHKIEFSPDELRTIFLGGDEKFDTLYKQFIQDWKVEETANNQQNLFGDLF